MKHPYLSSSANGQQPIAGKHHMRTARTAFTRPTKIIERNRKQTDEWHYVIFLNV